MGTIYILLVVILRIPMDLIWNYVTLLDVKVNC